MPDIEAVEPAKKKNKVDAAEIKAKLREKKPEKVVDYNNGLSWGSTLMNMGSTGRTTVGIPPGYYVLVVGDSDSGKTYFNLSVLAEASINPAFADYRLIYDATERGALMDIRKHFGKKLLDRLEPPRLNKNGSPAYSRLVEEFGYNVHNALCDGRPFIYILDSQDPLHTKEDHEKYLEQKAAFEKGRDSAGSYGIGKARYFSGTAFGEIIDSLEKSKSILIIISQSRERIGFGFDKKTRSGGRALRFYAALEIWTSQKKKIKANYKGNKVTLGVQTIVEVRRSRFTGRSVTVEVPIYWASGIDDVTSCINWLIEWKHWKGTNTVVNAPEFKFNGSIEDLVQKIEKENSEKQLRLTVAETWKEIEAAVTLPRKSKYE